MGFLDLFKKKNNKYKVNPKDNQPRFVYGIPDYKRYEKEDKYNVNPEDNVPREVYGIANPSKYDINPKDNIPEKVYGIKVDRNINKDDTIKRCKTCNCLVQEYIYGKVRGDIDTIKYKLGGCEVSPNNPVYYCPNCKIDLDKDLNPKNVSLSEVIKELMRGDPFWSTLLEKYFANENIEESVAVSLLNEISKDKQILNEFTKYLVKQSYDVEKPLIINGVTAKEIANNNPNKKAIEVYSMMSKLKNK